MSIVPIKNFSSELIGLSRINVSWLITEPTQVGYMELYKSSNNGYTFLNIARLTSTDIYYLDEDVEARKGYIYYLKVFNAIGAELGVTVQTKTIVSNVTISGFVRERGSEIPFGITNIYITDLKTNEKFTVQTDEYGNYEALLVFGEYEFLINDVINYEIVKQHLKLDRKFLNRSTFNFPNKAIDENIMDPYGGNAPFEGTAVMFKMRNKNLATKFADPARPIESSKDQDLELGNADFIVRGTGSKIQQVDYYDGIIRFDRPPVEQTIQVTLLNDYVAGSRSIVVDNATGINKDKYIIVHTSKPVLVTGVNANVITISEPLTSSYKAGVYVRGAILVTYFYNKGARDTVKLNFYLLKTATNAFLQILGLGVTHSFWSFNTYDTNFFKILQMYAEEFTTFNESMLQILWNNYLYDSKRRDGEYIPKINEGLVPYHDVDKESIWNNFGVYVGRKIGIRQPVDDYRAFVRAVFKIFLEGPTKDAKVFNEVLIESASGGEFRFYLKNYPIVKGSQTLRLNYNGLNISQKYKENLATNLLNNTIDGTAYSFQLENDRMRNIKGEFASIDNILVEGTTKKVVLLDALNGIVYFQYPPTTKELNDGIYVSYWYDNKTILYENGDYYINPVTGEIELFEALVSGDKLTVDYTRRSVYRDVIGLFLDNEISRNHDFTYSADLKDFYIYDRTQEQLLLRRALLAGDGYSLSGEFSENINIDNKLTSHPQAWYTNSFFEAIVRLSDNFDFRDIIIENLVDYSSGGQIRARLGQYPIVESSLNLELIGSLRETTPGFLNPQTDWKYVNNIPVKSKKRIAQAIDENLLENGMDNKNEDVLHFKLRHKNIKDLNGEVAVVSDIVVRGTTVKIKKVDSIKGEILFYKPITKTELLTGVTVTYWYDYFEELFVNVESDTYNVVDFYLADGIVDSEQVLAHYKIIGRGLKKKDDDIKWLMDLTKPATTYYDLVFSIKVNPVTDNEIMNLDNSVGEIPHYKTFNVFLSSNLNSLSNSDIIRQFDVLSAMRQDEEDLTKFYLTDSILVNSFGLMANKNDVLINGTDAKIISISSKDGWVKFNEEIDDLNNVNIAFRYLEEPSLVAGGILY